MRRPNVRGATLMCVSLVAALAMADVPCPPIFSPNETVLFQGDSITDGNRGRSADPNHILGHSYVFNIASMYGASYPQLGLNFINRGVSGDTVDDMAARWDADTISLKPDVLSVLVGANDVVRAVREHQPYSIEKLEADYDRLLAATLKAKPGTKLILGEPFVLKVGMVAQDYGAWRKATAEVARAVDRLGDKYHAPVVRFQSAFDEALKRAPADHWIWDGIHPTYSGHQLMAEEWVRTYNEFYVSPLRDPKRNPAIAPEVNFERDCYDWLHRHADVLDAQARIRPEVVLIGDSITHFWGGEPKAAQVHGPTSWDETFGGVPTLNLGFGWDRTQNVLWRLKHGEFVGLTPKTIILNIGTNNLVGDETARTDTPQETAVGIEAIVDLLRERSPRSRIFVMAVFPRGFEQGNPLDRSIGELNAILTTALALKPNVTLLDIGRRLRERDGSISPATLSDGTHPTDHGYAIWGRALREAGAIPKG